MSQRDVASVATELAAGPRPRQGTTILHRLRIADAWRPAELPREAEEMALRRRARRQGLLLIVGSSALSIFLLYELWNLIRSVV